MKHWMIMASIIGAFALVSLAVLRMESPALAQKPVSVAQWTGAEAKLTRSTTQNPSAQIDNDENSENEHAPAYPSSIRVSDQEEQRDEERESADLSHLARITPEQAKAAAQSCLSGRRRGSGAAG